MNYQPKLLRPIAFSLGNALPAAGGGSLIRRIAQLALLISLSAPLCGQPPTSTDRTRNESTGAAPEITARSSPSLNLSPSSLDFGARTVGISPPPATLSIAGVNGQPVTFVSFAISGPNASDFSIALGGCALKGPISGCSPSINFVPTSTGMRTASLVITDNALGSPQSVPLSGIGIAQIGDIGLIRTYAGDEVSGYRGDGSAASNAWLSQPEGMISDSSGNLYISDLSNNVIRRVDAKTGLISTYAGKFTVDGGHPHGSYSGDGGPATNARLNSPAGLALDASGDLYFVDAGNSVIRKVTASTGIITTVAGLVGNQCDYQIGESGDGGPAVSASLCFPGAIALDRSGNLYIADTSDNVIRLVTANTGIISTIAGSSTGQQGFQGDGGPATQALLTAPFEIKLDNNDNLFIADTDNSVVRKIKLSTGIITTVAGQGDLYGYSGDGGAATKARLSFVFGIAVDASANLYIADHDNSVIRRVDASTGVINTVAGNGRYGFSGDGGRATSAELTFPVGIEFDASGDLYVADINNNAIRKISFKGAVPAIATPLLNPPAGDPGSRPTISITDATPGTTIFYTTNGATPTSSSTRYSMPFSVMSPVTVRAIAIRVADSSAVASAHYTTETSPILTVAPAGLDFGMLPVGRSAELFLQLENPGTIPDSVTSISITGANAADFAAGNACSAYLGRLQTCYISVVFTPSGDGVRSAQVVLSSNAANAARPISLTGQASGIRIVTDFAGLTRTAYGNGIAAINAELGYPQGIALDSSGNRYIADTYSAQVRKVNAKTGVISVVAGTGQSGYSGDGQLAVDAQLSFPGGVAVDAIGNIYIADTDNSVIRKVDAATGIITTIAGNGQFGFSGDGGPANMAELGGPVSVAVDKTGNIYIADTDNLVVRKIAAKSDIISTVAGIPNSFGYSGDGGPATSATMSFPFGVAVNANGDIYIADVDNFAVRKVSAATGFISTYAGNGSYGASGDNGPATEASLSTVQGVGVDSSGNVYIADTQTNAVRKVTASTGIITTVAGNYQQGFSGDGGAATQASVSQPNSIAVDQSGDLYIADTGNNRIRRVSPAQVISTSAGNGRFSPISSGISATSASIATSSPTAVVADSAGNVYFADTLNNVVRKVSVTNSAITVVAGNGQPGYTGDGGSATDAELNSPGGLAIDQGGSLYVADSNNNVVRKVNVATGIISTFAGNGTLGFGGDGGPATDAPLIRPEGLAVDAAGNVYIATPEVSVVRMVTHQGTIYTVAGNGQLYQGNGPNGDGGPATEAELGDPVSLAVDQLGNLYIGDRVNDVVREVNGSTGIINTIAGTGQYGESGDGGPALKATIGGPDALSTDPFGNLYMADGYTVRAINSDGIINTIVGQGGFGYSGDGGLVAAAQSSAVGVAVDSASNIYFADAIGDRIHKISTASTTQKATAIPTFAPAAGSYGSAQAVTISDATPGAQIFYTLDGSAPSPAASSLYGNPLSLLGSVTLSAVAIAPGRSVSGVASEAYTFPNLGIPLMPATRSRVATQILIDESQSHRLAAPQPVVGKAEQHYKDGLIVSRRLVYRYLGQTKPR